MVLAGLCKSRKDNSIYLDVGAHDFLIPFASLTLEAPISSGSGGIVYRGSCRDFADGVAIKELFSPVRDGASAKGVMLEASILAKLRHPNVILLFGVSVHLPRIYLVMELAAQSLETWLLSTQRMIGATVLKYAVQAASALQFLVRTWFLDF